MKNGLCKSTDQRVQIRKAGRLCNVSPRGHRKLVRRDPLLKDLQEITAFIKAVSATAFKENEIWTWRKRGRSSRGEDGRFKG